jgi:UDP-N-acetylglucosamine:LPS N-acetylglucosamine transferase
VAYQHQNTALHTCCCHPAYALVLCITPAPTGLPIRPIFSKPLPARKQLRKRLGLDPSLPAVLLVGGGEGMGKLEETVAQLDGQLGDKAQVGGAAGRASSHHSICQSTCNDTDLQ